MTNHDAGSCLRPHLDHYPVRVAPLTAASNPLIIEPGATDRLDLHGYVFLTQLTKPEPLTDRRYKRYVAATRLYPTVITIGANPLPAFGPSL
jgi:hypothetical protein